MIHHQIHIFLYIILKTSIISALVINEVADKGSSSACGGADWIELWNDGNEQVTLSEYILHDDKGILDEGAFRFPQGYTLAPNEYKVLCCDDDPTNPQFGIGGDDTITLLDDSENVVSTVGPLLNKGIFDVTYALQPDGSGYDYTMTPTPGSQNVMTPLPTVEEIKAELTARNSLGTRFFGMDDNGYPVEDSMEDVLDLKLVMEDEDYLYTLEHPWHEVYRPFTSGQLLQRSDGTEILSFTSPGRLRPKGQSTLYFAICLGVPSITFSIDFDETNPDQTLFGVGRVYLRNKLSDRSYMREWVFHRMLARFGLPHLRTRTVRFFLNDQYIGLYDLMEAPDSDSVFHRSFPDYDLDNHALYKIKTASTSCGKQKWYNEGNITAAYERINDTTPYSFERGEHRQDVPVLNDTEECNDGFQDVLKMEKLDAVLAYVRNGEDCGEMLVEEGLVDRDFGVDSWDPAMKAFINEHLSNSTCADGCAGSSLANEVDVDNFLKVFAVFSTIMHQDSPLGTGNNYYLVQTGNDDGWKMVPYDMDNAATRVGVQICGEECATRMVHWSIFRPTCKALEDNQLAGPLLSDPSLYDQYLDYVRDFVNTILTNETFLDEIEQHAAAIQADVVPDGWNTYYSHDYSSELSSTAAPWYATGFPLLAVLRARADDVLAQLEALDSGYESETIVDAEQKCVDWRGNDVIPDSCHNNCQYDGCQEPSWTVQGVCDILTGICYHGQYDDNCAGIPNGGTYPGIVQRNGELVFCQDMIALSACLPPEFTVATDTSTPLTTTTTTEIPTDELTGTEPEESPTTMRPTQETTSQITTTQFASTTLNESGDVQADETSACAAPTMLLVVAVSLTVAIGTLLGDM